MIALKLVGPGTKVAPIGLWLTMKMNEETSKSSCSGLVVKSVVAIDGPRVRFTAAADFFGVSSEYPRNSPSHSK